MQRWIATCVLDFLRRLNGVSRSISCGDGVVLTSFTGSLAPDWRCQLWLTNQDESALFVSPVNPFAFHRTNNFPLTTIEVNNQLKLKPLMVSVLP